MKKAFTSLSGVLCSLILFTMEMYSLENPHEDCVSSRVQAVKMQHVF